MNGWRLAVALAIAVGAGYILRSWKCLIRCQETHIRLYRQLLASEANQDHAKCNEVIEKLDAYLADQEARLDAYAHPERVWHEAERITRGDL